MRFTVEFEVGQNYFPVDYRKIFTSYISSLICNCNDETEKSICEECINNSKKFTFAVYFRKPVFSDEEISFSEKIINLNFSCYDQKFGSVLYEIFNRNPK